MKKSLKLERNGYVVHVESAPGSPEEAARQLVTQAEAIERQLIESFGKEAFGKKGGAKVDAAVATQDDEAVSAWLETQDAPRSRRYIAEHCPLPTHRVNAAVKRMLKSGALELRPATFTDVRGTDRPMQGVFFADSSRTPLLPQQGAG